jgi:hypothetical protein
VFGAEVLSPGQRCRLEARVAVFKVAALCLRRGCGPKVEIGIFKATVSCLGQGCHS